MHPANILNILQIKIEEMNQFEMISSDLFSTLLNVDSYFRFANKSLRENGGQDEPAEPVEHGLLARPGDSQRWH